MDFRRLTLFCLLFLLGYFLYQAKPRPAIPAVMPGQLSRLKRGEDTEDDRLALAKAVARACGLSATRLPDADPHLVRADFLPGGGDELALAAQVSPTGGLLALLVVRDGNWRVASHWGPDRLGVPTSMSPLALPGRREAGLILTELADQMAGAFCRREVCGVYAADGAWRRLWAKEIDAVSYWNRAWNHPPGQGWLRLASIATWKPVRTPGGLRISVSYRNTLAEAAGNGRLPEEDKFTIDRESTGQEEFVWDPGLGLFVLGYARTAAAARLLARQGAAFKPTGTVLPAGQAVAILADGAGDPRSLLGQARLLEVLAPGQTGFLAPATIRRLPVRPADFPGLRQPWLRSP